MENESKIPEECNDVLTEPSIKSAQSSARSVPVAETIGTLVEYEFRVGKSRISFEASKEANAAIFVNDKPMLPSHEAHAASAVAFIPKELP